jgi:hypothetical protein
MQQAEAAIAPNMLLPTTKRSQLSFTWPAVGTGRSVTLL